ncbi:centrosomal protein of 162 kDa-like isoform X1 [Amphiura filiformis]|uniref:centrosomal protein of 162 kDa-like isoform X1 n=1 Tax=Amphiura filiformis TaxID=82378 RepID=UPI003B212047
MLKGVCDRLMHERFQGGQTTEAEARKPTAHGSSSETSKKPSGTSRRKPSSEDDMGSKQYEPRNFAGSHISDVLMENERLKQQMESLSLEMEQHRLRVQATLAEAESNVRKTKEATAEEMSAMKSRHVEEMEKLMAERALSHSDSQVARLTNQVESQKVLIGHLQEQLSDVRVEADTAAASRVREQVMKTQLDQLRVELHDAKKSHTPEMRHFEALQSKICAMEARHYQREQELHLLVERAKHTATIEKDHEIAHCHQQLTKKNAEIQRFRAELDSILEVLRELQRQGVILPLHSQTVQSLL